MGIRSALFATAVVFLSTANLAQAASTVVNLPGTIGPGMTDFTVYDSGAGGVAPGFLTNTLSGTIGGDETATFTYTLEGGASFTGNSLSVAGSSGANSSNSTAPFGGPSFNSTTPTINPLVFSNASFGASGGFFTITNNTLGLENFQALLFGNLSAAGELIITMTTAVSSVPLPATATLFGLGLALIAGIGLMKRKQSAS